MHRLVARSVEVIAEKKKGDDVDGDDECLGAISSLYAASDVAACECC